MEQQEDVRGPTMDGPATYRIRVPEQGMWPLNLYYKDKVLTTEVGSTPRSNEVNLFVEVFQGQYKLRAEWVDPNPHRVR